jgi:hypothetical protein
LNSVNALGGARKVQFLGESPEYLKLADFHRYLPNRWKSSYQSIGQICESDSNSHYEIRLADHKENATLASLLNRIFLP